jgi:integrase
MQGKRTPTGLRARHSQGCSGARGGACICSPSWEAWVFVPREKKKIRKTFPTQAAAKAWRADAQVALRKGTLRTPSRVTLREAAAKWIDGARVGLIRTRSGDPYKPSALRGYEAALRKRILPTLGSARLGELKRVDLQDIVEHLLGEGLSASSIRNVIVPVRAIYRRAVTRGEVTVNPTIGLELPAVRGGRDRIASPGEAQKLLAALPLNDRAVWATALYAGLRRGELQALRWEDVDLDAGLIRVERSYDDKERMVIEPKSRAGRRSVPIATILRTYLLEQRLRSGRRQGLVFGGTHERFFCPSTLSRRARRAWTKAELLPITLHEGRHTFASLMIAAGVNAKALSTYMGHSSVTITYDRYGHLMPGNENESVALLDGYLARCVQVRSDFRRTEFQSDGDGS